MSNVVINGGMPLKGRVLPSGSKNAALPILFAAIATKGKSKIYNVPDIGDVKIALEILRILGAGIDYSSEVLILDTEKMQYAEIPRVLTSSIRASSYLIGACLARFGRFHLSDFGGCNFCNRPIDMHLSAAEVIGARIIDNEITADRLSGGHIVFNIPSVGATVNALIMSASAESDTVIEGAAIEPHVRAVAKFLTSAGAHIEFCGNKIYVTPGGLSGGEITVIPDMIEAGTYLLAAPVTGGRISVEYPYPEELESFLDMLSASNTGVSVVGNEITVYGFPTHSIDITTAPYPGYPTDLQPQLAPLMARYCGGIIHERVWEKRFSYLASLAEFGVKYRINFSDAMVFPSVLSPAETAATDLRGGASALLTALAAPGQSKIENTEIIERGYSDIWNKLSDLGARIIDFNV